MTDPIKEGSRASPPPSAASFAPAHDLHGSPSNAASAAAAAKAAMQARRRSRGMGEGLRPDFVFPKPQQQQQTQTPPSSLSGTTAITATTTTGTGAGVATNGSTSIPHHHVNGSSIGGSNGADLLAPPRLQPHLKTHYRTHSRNGSTVTVQDLKQAIATVDLQDLPPLAGLTSSQMPALKENVVAAAAAAPAPAQKTMDAPAAARQSPPPLPKVSTTLPEIAVLSAVSTPTSPRPSSMILNRTARDRSNVSVPPFFAYSIPHEFPSPYTSPRLKLSGTAGPSSLPISPFARKRKHTSHFSAHIFPSPTITIKLTAKDQAVQVPHGLAVGDVHDVELLGYEMDQLVVTEKEQPKQDESHSVPVKKEAPSPANLSAADKRMSWASMVTLDEGSIAIGLATKGVTPTTVPTSQPYRPPGSRSRAAAENKAANSANVTNGTYKAPGRSSPTLATENIPPTVDTPEPATSPVGRSRRAAPPPLNLTGNSNLEIKSAPGSPTTPTSSSRRRRSRSRKNAKDKSVDGAQQDDSVDKVEDSQAKESSEVLDSQDALENQSETTSTTGASDQPKKTRTRSRSRSRSRSRAHADNGSSQGSSNESVPPVPKTPSWVPAHNMTVTIGAPPAAALSTLPVQTPLSPITASPVTNGTLEPPLSPNKTSAPWSPNSSTFVDSELKRRGPRPARLLSTRSSHNLQLQTLTEGGPAAFSPRSAREGPSDYFSMRPLQHPPRTPMTPGGDYDDDDDYYGRLQMVTTPMIQNGFFPNWAKGDAQLEELERIRLFLSARQYPDEMPLSDEWTLFFSDTSRAKDKSQVQDAYSSAITPLFTCHTVPQFATSWKYVRERVRPATMKVNQNLHWFKKGIKPMWEDPKNKYGGRLTLCPPRALLDVVWETVLILMAGDVLDHHGEGTGAVFARRARGDRVEVWLGSDDTPEALAHIRGVLIQELTASGADELVRSAKYKKHFDGRKEEKLKQQQLKDANAAAAAASGTPGGVATSSSTVISAPLSATPMANNLAGLSSPLLPTTPRLNGGPSSFSSSSMGDFQTFEAFAQHQQQQQQMREREREKDREISKEQERIMQLGRERLEKERAEKDRLRDERVRAMAAAAIAASEVKHQQQLKEQRERDELLQQQQQQ